MWLTVFPNGTGKIHKKKVRFTNRQQAGADNQKPAVFKAAKHPPAGAANHVSAI